MVPLFRQFGNRTVISKFFQRRVNFRCQFFFFLIDNNNDFIDFNRLAYCHNFNPHRFCCFFHTEVIRVYHEIILAGLKGLQAIRHGKSVLNWYFFHDIVMGSVPVGEDFINAAVRCIRYLFAILYRIFQIGKFILILFQYINHDGTCTYGRVRNDIVLFAAGCPVITAGSDFRIARFHHDVLRFRRNCFNIQRIIFQILVHFLPYIIFKSLDFSIFILPGNRPLRAGYD